MSDQVVRRFRPPEPLAPLTWADRARALWRLPWILLATALVVPVFFVARWMMGRRDRAVAALWARILLRLLGLRLDVVGAPMAGPGALVANHVSWLDILALSAAAPVHFVSKAEVAGWPVIGFLAKISGTEFIERRSAQAREHEARLRARLLSGDLLCFFPEGTSADGETILPFKTTLFAIFTATGAPAQPVTLVYEPPAHLPKRFYGYYDDIEFGPHALSCLARSTRGRVRVIFHPPQSPAALPDRKALAAACEALVREGAAQSAEALRS